ncbi:MAG: hypothetical protein P8X60_03230 [Robiginitalea sp.]
MLRLAGSADRLRPHIKTHKMAEIIRMQLERGIHKFKCATLAEAELLARCKARDVLLAYPLTGPGPGRLADLQKKYPETQPQKPNQGSRSRRSPSGCFHGPERRDEPNRGPAGSPGNNLV